MSGNLREEDYNKNSNLEKTFKQVRKVNDPRFGEAFLYQEPTTRQQILVRERKYNDKTEAGKAILAARARMGNQNPNQLRMLDYSASKQSELCSTIYIVRQYWEAPASDLKRELQNRASGNTPFSEAELSNILYQVAKGDASGLHGDISPLSVAYDRAGGVAKLIDRSDELPSPQRTVNLQKAKVIGAAQNLYQSPTMYSNLKRNNLKFNYDPAKEDAFALGLTMLELGNLKPVSGIYNATTKEVDRNALTGLVNEFKNRYPNPNGFLVHTVEGLTKYEEAQRLGIRELAAGLPPEADFRARIASGAGAAPNVRVATGAGLTTGATTSVTQTLDVKSHTIPASTGPAPNIYQLESAHNEFYSRPNLPPIPVPQPAESIVPKYTPIPDSTPTTTSSIIVTPEAPKTTTTTTREVVVHSATKDVPVSTPIQAPVEVTRRASYSYTTANAPVSSISYNATLINGELRRNSGQQLVAPVEVKSASHSYRTGSTGYVASPVTYTPPVETYVTSAPYVTYDNLPRRSHVTLPTEIRRSYVSGPPLSPASIGLPQIVPSYPTIATSMPTTETIVYSSNPANTFYNGPVTTVINDVSPITYAPQSYISKPMSLPSETVTSAYVTPSYGYTTSYIPSDTIVTSNPTTTYVPTETYVTSTQSPSVFTSPSTYVTSSPSNYIPTETYVTSPSTYINANPTTYISSNPTTTYVNATPTTTYINANPTTTYVNATPTTTTYINANPTTYVTETLTQAPSTIVTGQRASLSPIPSGPRRSYTRVITEGTTSTGTTTIISGDSASVGGMRLVSTYQDPKYATSN